MSYRALDVVFFSPRQRLDFLCRKKKPRKEFSFMNKTFKTLWNDVRRCYIVANEAQKSHGKPSKCAVAVAVAAQTPGLLDH